MRTIALTPLGSRLEAGDHIPLLRWLLLNALALFGFLAAWHFGLVQLMVRSDASYISLVIIAVYIGTTLHCFFQTLYISRQSNAARRVAAQVAASEGRLRYAGDDVLAMDGRALEPCVLTGHIRNLITKARLQTQPELDQTILLQSLAEHLRSRQQFGWFVSNAVFKLGLLGTVIGFILMLSPIGRIDVYDVESMRAALTTMSSGMAIALFTTLAGLIGGLLLMMQYYVLDSATADLVRLNTEVTEVYVVPRLERTDAHAV